MYHRRKFNSSVSGAAGSYLDTATKPVNPYISTPGSFISDLFFYGELSRVAGVDAGHTWFSTQMAARSKGTTMTPSTPCKSPYSSAPGSPRTRPHSVDLDETLEYTVPPLSSDGSRTEGGSCYSIGSKSIFNNIPEHPPPVRMASSGYVHPKRADYRGKQSWRRWKSYDGARQVIQGVGGEMDLAEQEHEEAQASSSSSSSDTASEPVYQPNFPCPPALPATTASAEPQAHASSSSPQAASGAAARGLPPLHPSRDRRSSTSAAPSPPPGDGPAAPPGSASPLRLGGSGGRKGSVDLRLDSHGGIVVSDGADGGGAGRSLTMAELAELVSSDAGGGAGGAAAVSNMALLFTDAAHTVFQ